MNKKWNVRRNKGYLRVHVAVGMKIKKILSMKVTYEHVHDSEILPNVVDAILKTNGDLVDQLLADGAYDSNEIFRYVSENGSTPW